MIKRNLISTVLLIFFACGVFAMGSNENKNTISVIGNGKVIVESDTATISLSVVTSDKDAAQSAQKNAVLMTKVQDTLINIGLKKEDFSTSNYSIYEHRPYNPKDGSYSQPEYRTSNNIIVTVKDISKTGTVIDTALKGGANQLSSLTFSSSKIHLAYEEARLQAVRDARDKATALANAAGRELGKAIIIEEANAYAEPVFYDNAKMMAVRETSVETPIVAEGSTAQYSLRIVFELK